MAVHVTEMNIGSYRGLQNVRIKDLGDFNIVLGDNNSGKTSLLELLAVLEYPMDLKSWIDNITCRCGKYDISTIYNDIQQIFKIGSPESFINCEYTFGDGNIFFINISQNISEVTLNLSDVRRIDRRAYYSLRDNENDENQFSRDESIYLKSLVKNFTFTGKFNKESECCYYDIYDFSTMIPSNRRAIENKNHLLNTAFRNYLSNDYAYLDEIINNNKYHKMLINLLKQFDSSIEDIIVSPSSNRQYLIRTNTCVEPIPMTCFGDGVRQAISIFAYMIFAKNGILLIDEFDSAVHAHRMPPTIEMIIKMCKKLNIQLFISTHNAEAIEKFLDGTGEYLSESRILRLRKLKSGKTICKTINGKDALDNIRNLKMEYRI